MAVNLRKEKEEYHYTYDINGNRLRILKSALNLAKNNCKNFIEEDSMDNKAALELQQELAVAQEYFKPEALQKFLNSSSGIPPQITSRTQYPLPRSKIKELRDLAINLPNLLVNKKTKVSDYYDNEVIGAVMKILLDTYSVLMEIK